MENSLHLEYFVSKDQEGQYLTLPFKVPPETERLALSYSYQRYREEPLSGDSGDFISWEEVNIIDLGLVDSKGAQVGASGSDKAEIEISAVNATPGYRPSPLVEGSWQILLGAYKVAPGGVKVSYEITFTPKQRRLLKGDLHVHTLASDGVQSIPELAQRALRNGLDFLAITDHNQLTPSDALPQIPGITLIPGVEWTHFQGHASFLGVDQPYDGPFFTNTFEGVQEMFSQARQRGALISINHPFEEVCPFRFDLQALPFDCLEIWNGPMRESNLRAMALWQQLLESGRQVPICGGSDYHRDQLFIFPGGPTTCVYALSDSPGDILTALGQGHAYVVFAPDGPTLELNAGEVNLGDQLPFTRETEVQLKVNRLRTGDRLVMVTAAGSTPVKEVKTDGIYEGMIPIDSPGFVRFEVWRSFVPGLPHLPALVTNPVYYTEA